MKTKEVNGLWQYKIKYPFLIITGSTLSNCEQQLKCIEN